MFTRIASCLIALACVLSPAHGFTTTTKSGPTTSVSFKVEYRRPGKGWVVRNTYPNSEAAAAEADRLYKAGFDIRVTKAETITLLRTQGGPTPEPGRKVPPSDTTTSGGISVVSLAKANQLFRVMANRGDIAFKFPADGCYARAHLMGIQMQGMGLKPGKAWAFDDKASVERIPPRLVALTDAHPKGFVRWWYHVAPALKVRDQNGRVSVYVIDPSLHRSAVPLSTWQKRMMHPSIKNFTPRMDVTVWGQAPRTADGRRFPGTGYAPCPDPSNLTAAARKTMADYKPLQGTDRFPARLSIASRGKDTFRPATAATKELAEAPLEETTAGK
jgi:hypothetical protein